MDGKRPIPTSEERVRCYSHLGGLLGLGFAIRSDLRNLGSVSCEATFPVLNVTALVSLELMDYQVESDVVITNLVVPAQHRRLGFGRTIVVLLVAWARTSGMNGEIRATQVAEDAIPFWRAVGFERLPEPNPNNDYAYSEEEGLDGDV